MPTCVCSATSAHPDADPFLSISEKSSAGVFHFRTVAGVQQTASDESSYCGPAFLSWTRSASAFGNQLSMAFILLSAWEHRASFLRGIPRHPSDAAGSEDAPPPAIRFDSCALRFALRCRGIVTEQEIRCSICGHGPWT